MPRKATALTDSFSSLLNSVVSKSDNIIDARYIRLSVRYSFNRKHLKRFENHQGYNGDGNRL